MKLFRHCRSGSEYLPPCKHVFYLDVYKVLIPERWTAHVSMFDILRLAVYETIGKHAKLMTTKQFRSQLYPIRE